MVEILGMSIATLMVIFGFIGLVYFYSKKKKDSAMILGVILILGVLMGGLSFAGVSFEGLTVTPPAEEQGAVVPAGCGALDTVKIYAKNKYTMADADEDIELYSLGADVSNSNVNELSKTDISSGVGTDSSYFITTCSDEKAYDLWFEGGSTYYNEKIADWRAVGSTDTGKGVLMFGDLSYYGATPFGTFTDFDSVQSSTSSSVFVDASTDVFNYDESSGSGSFYASWLIGNDASNSELRDVVFCIQDGNSSSTLDGDEVSSIAVSYISGTDVDTYNVLSGEIVSQWQASVGSGSYVCKKIADNIGNNANGEYKFTFTVSEAKWDVGENFKFCLDDLGTYGALQYPDANAKATASCVTIGNQA